MELEEKTMNRVDQQGHPEPDMELTRERKGRKVPVLYYLCRNQQLEHPHFIEVTLVSPDGLYLRDVIEKFDSLRGRGMASMYSWSCKRSYKNAFVWNDLGEDDLIVPAHENEYILKGSELVEENYSDDYSSSTNVMDDGCRSLTKYKIYKSTHGLADASTQTDEHVNVQQTCTRSLLTDNGPVDSLTNDSPSSSGACSSACKTDTLESLMKADDHHFHTSKKIEEEEEEEDNDDEYQVPTNTKIRGLLQLISCGSVSPQDHNLSQSLTCRSKSLDSKSRIISSSVMLGELDCLSENRKYTGMQLGDKQYFSGSLVETKLLKNEEIHNLKRSSSFSANRMKCTPRSIMGSLSRHSKSASMRFCENPNSCIQSPCLSNNGSNRITSSCLSKKPSKRTESFGDNKENVIKIEERLSSGARVIIHLEANDCPALS
ncbi:protein UPSTREAM OF FLC isoform X2 [Helianthus annuus]|uniref:protein UPSTREAM OF FLC isoform X2 n=1 Tax=Helianthus annuus TaxID=4232 RepID=UPI000B8FF974|nr:protein UPSTREAM OF FLC isoform X2 [Helianthus annuus]